MKILIFDLANENAILAKLRKNFPSIGFKKQKISDDIEEEGRDIVLIDTVKGLQTVTLIDDPNDISPGKSEIVMTLRILLKLGLLDSVKIIGVPSDYDQEVTVEEINSIITSLLVK